MNFEETIKSIIQEVLDVDTEEITYNSYLIDDLGADELDIGEIIGDIENKFSIKLDLEDFNLTVHDLIESVKVSEPAETTRKLLDKPRKLHYVFVHKYLKDLIFKEGVNLFADLRIKRGYDFMPGNKMIAGQDLDGNPILDGYDYLIQLWNRLSEKLECKYIDPSQLDYEIAGDSSGNLILLFVFPEPLAAGEAFYSLFIWKHVQTTGAYDYHDVVKQRAVYYTLELSFDNKVVIGQWIDNTHINHGSYDSVLTPKQFLDEVLLKFKNNNETKTDTGKDRTVKDEDFSINSKQVKYGKISKDHIYSNIILSFANKLNVPVSEINKNISIHNLQRDDFIEIICGVYEMYKIDFQKYIPYIERCVDGFFEDKDDFGFVFLKICQHFESMIEGDINNPVQDYWDYRKILSLILQTSEFSILHHLIPTIYPSIFGENLNSELLSNKELLYNEILSIPEKFLSRNYPIEPRKLLVCLIATSIAHFNYTHSEDKAIALLKSATEINTRWGPYIESNILADLKNQTMISNSVDKNKNSCFIATAVYGSPYANEVIVLKQFRDEWLLNFRLGRIFVRLYYWLSPPIAKQIAKRKFIKNVTKKVIIVPLINIANNLKRKVN